MFEEICLVCGKYLKDDGRAYCSDDCQNRDASSPSISSSSSALSSPQLGYAHGGDVPILTPSALGSALKGYSAGYSAGYHSSASSTSWSVVTDEEDDSPSANVSLDYRYPHLHDPSDPLPEGTSKFIQTVQSSALSYARRPSGINNRTTVPHPRRQSSSGPPPKPSYAGPRSAPIHSHSLSNDDQDAYSDIGFLSGDALDNDEQDLHSEKSWVDGKPKYPGSKTKRSRNRASLPAYFSLLQMKSPSKHSRSSPVSSSSGTIARLSPPTPKLTSSTTRFSQVDVATDLHATVYATPRGRRREADKSRSSRRSGHSSPSRSRSRPQRIMSIENAKPVEYILSSHMQPKPSTEQLRDRPSVPGDIPNRGRATVRRNSSPPPKTPYGAVDPAILAAAMTTKITDRSPSNDRSRPRTRGRVRVDVVSVDAPGYGHGRSGLVDRGRTTGSHLNRVPL